MMICITAQAPGLDAPAGPRFARAPFFIFIETGTGEAHSVANALCGGPGGIGPRAVQFVVEYGVEALVTGRMGEHAVRALRAAGIPAYAFAGESTVADALEAYRSGTLPELS